MTVYYNEIEPAAAHVLRALIDAEHIARGDVDERSIQDVQPEDLRGYTQCHFFAGAGLWSVALRLAGWDDARPIFTGSCPCQPFSVAGKGAGKNDKRHLWPDFFRLIEACRPAVVMGEQVSGAAGYDWFDGVAADLERANYAARALDIPACAVDAPHIRQRLYWCGVALGDPYNPRPQGYGRPVGLYDEERRQEPVGCVAEAGVCNVGDASRQRRTGQPVLLWQDSARRDAQEILETPRSSHPPYDLADTESIGRGRWENVENEGRRELAFTDTRPRSFWAGAELRSGADGKTRRAQPGVPLLVTGMAGRIHALRLAGNSIVPTLAAEVIAALMETLP